MRPYWKNQRIWPIKVIFLLRLTQPFILPRSVKWAPEISGNLVVKSKLPPRSGSSLEAVEPHPWKEAINFFFIYANKRFPQRSFLVINCVSEEVLTLKLKTFKTFNINSSNRIFSSMHNSINKPLSFDLCHCYLKYRRL